MKKFKILIVEDEPSYLRLIKDRLHTLGYLVVQAANGEKGLSVTKKEHPDLILLDIRMPKMDGMTMLQKLRKSEWGKKVRVILLTNIDPDDSIIQRSITDQPIHYLIKSDITLNDLIKKIQKCLVKPFNFNYQL